MGGGGVVGLWVIERHFFEEFVMFIKEFRFFFNHFGGRVCVVFWGFCIDVPDTHVYGMWFMPEDGFDEPMHPAFFGV